MADGKFLLTLNLNKQGVIKGSSTRKVGPLDFSKGLECHAFEYGATTPVGLQSGLPTGKRMHKPVTIIREVDVASPKLLQALVTNEGFREATLQFNRTSPDGKPVVAHTITLTNGTIVAVKSYHGTGGTKSEAVTLVYDGLLVNGIRAAMIPK